MGFDCSRVCRIPCGGAGNQYFGICHGVDGQLYCAPRNASTVLVIEPESRTLSFVEGAGDGSGKYGGICSGADGRLYCAPNDASTVLVIDPWARTTEVIAGGGEEGALGRSRWRRHEFHGMLFWEVPLEAS